jgi:hypothetical protein
MQHQQQQRLRRASSLSTSSRSLSHFRSGLVRLGTVQKYRLSLLPASSLATVHLQLAWRPFNTFTDAICKIKSLARSRLVRSFGLLLLLEPPLDPSHYIFISLATDSKLILALFCLGSFVIAVIGPSLSLSLSLFRFPPLQQCRQSARLLLICTHENALQIKQLE